MSDVTALNEKIAQIKGWTHGEGRCQYQGCDALHWRDADGKNVRNWPPDWSEPAMWAGLLAELDETSTGIQINSDLEGHFVTVIRVGMTKEKYEGQGETLGLAVCRAYVAAEDAS